MTQRHLAGRIDPAAGIIRPAMDEGVAHRLHPGSGGISGEASGELQKTDDTTHTARRPRQDKNPSASVFKRFQKFGRLLGPIILNRGQRPGSVGTKGKRSY